MDALLSPPLFHLPWQDVALGPLLAFLLASLIAWAWARTSRGLSFSAPLAPALVLGAIIAALLMLAIGDNLARGLGIVGSLAIIRFRTNLRDPRDIIFVFAALGVGVAAGVQAWLPALLGTALFLMAAALLHVAPIGDNHHRDGLLRFQAPTDASTANAVSDALRATTRRTTLVALREIAQGELADHTYHIILPTPDDPRPLLDALRAIPGLRAVTWLNPNHSVEV